MRRLLVVHHTPSHALQEMFEVAVSGARAVTGAPGSNDRAACWDRGALPRAGIAG